MPDYFSGELPCHFQLATHFLDEDVTNNHRSEPLINHNQYKSEYEAQNWVYKKASNQKDEVGCK